MDVDTYITSIQTRESADSALMKVAEPLLDAAVEYIVSNFSPVGIVLFGHTLAIHRGDDPAWVDMLLGPVDGHGRDTVSLRYVISRVYFPKGW